jgi:hypothetical protein
MAVRRFHVQLSEECDEALRRLAHDRGQSKSGLARQVPLGFIRKATAEHGEPSGAPPKGIAVSARRSST